MRILRKRPEPRTTRRAVVAGRPMPTPPATTEGPAVEPDEPVEEKPKRRRKKAETSDTPEVESDEHSND